MMQIREGFWRWAGEPTLPMPKSRAQPWSGQERFLRQLAAVEENADVLRYRGTSTCRCCGRSNGNAEYNIDGATWPAGLRHYIEDHNVKPSTKFIRFVESLATLDDQE